MRKQYPMEIRLMYVPKCSLVLQFDHNQVSADYMQEIADRMHAIMLEQFDPDPDDDTTTTRPYDIED